MEEEIKKSFYLFENKFKKYFQKFQINLYENKMIPLDDIEIVLREKKEKIFEFNFGLYMENKQIVLCNYHRLILNQRRNGTGTKIMKNLERTIKIISKKLNYKSPIIEFIDIKPQIDTQKFLEKLNYNKIDSDTYRKIIY